ncbi:MAG: OmpA family protein [Clostridia bacterium]|nr:OmpA family protein [Clostridia bacterium]
MSSHKKTHHEEHVDETWLIPYADMLTLLLALFIVMFAMSQVDKEKFQQISEQFNVIFSGGKGVMEGSDRSISPQLVPNKSSSASEVEDKKMNEIKKMLEEEIQKEGYTNEIKLVLNKDSLEIAVQDSVLFASGDAAIRDDVSRLFHILSKILFSVDNKIKVVGHTDNVPIKNSKFRSNWDLSAMRAINVMQFLVDKGKIPPTRFLVQGSGEFSPKFDNSTEAGRAKNRRVEIFIIRNYPLNETDKKETQADKKETQTDKKETSESH